MFLKSDSEECIYIMLKLTSELNPFNNKSLSVTDLKYECNQYGPYDVLWTLNGLLCTKGLDTIITIMIMMFSYKNMAIHDNCSFTK
jgi:hypothetical protein